MHLRRRLTIARDVRKLLRYLDLHDDLNAIGKDALIQLSKVLYIY